MMTTTRRGDEAKHGIEDRRQRQLRMQQEEEVILTRTRPTTLETEEE